ncbi:hypothetical protein ACFPQ1_24110 [Rhodocytophaga aerolata]|uniref:hypothetical protein n=1 Tax=Rhodocytophaga aerolata TaxID=455078 RepID=UPI003607987A
MQGQKAGNAKLSSESLQAGRYGQRKRIYIDPSLNIISPRELRGLTKKVQDRGWRRWIRPVFTPAKPGGKYSPTPSQNQPWERGKASCFLIGRGNISNKQVVSRTNTRSRIV